MGLFDDVAAKSSGSSFSLFGNSVVGQLANRAVNQAADSAMSKLGTNGLPIAQGVQALLNGNIGQAVGSILNFNVVSNLLSGNKSGILPHYLRTSPLLAGLSPDEAKRIVMLSYAINHARKNLWLIRVEPYCATSYSSLGGMISQMAGNVVSAKAGSAIGNAAANLVQQTLGAMPVIGTMNDTGAGMTSHFNMLATDVNYTPYAIEAEQYNVGAAVIDGAKSAQPAEITLTTMDDEYGTIKRFFKQKASEVIHRDGTVGLQSEGLLQVRIVHSFVSDNTNQNGFEETLIARVVSVDYDLSRKEDAFQEFQVRLMQTDTFLR